MSPDDDSLHTDDDPREDIPAPIATDLRHAPSADEDEDGGASRALEMAEEAELGARHLTGAARKVVMAIAAGWSLFQLTLPSFLTISSDYVRAIHLCFAISLVYLSFPALRKLKTRGRLGFLSARHRLPWIDVLLAVLAAGAASYYALDYVGMAARQGLPIPRDLVVGIVLIVLLLEAARRAFGPALSCVALAFILYGFFAPYMPEMFAFKAVSLRRMLNQLTMSQAGIYGIPLRVSASTVFLFVLFGSMLEKTGGGRYFVQLAFSLLGRYKGGPAKAAVCASGLTGMVSGSSIANTVTTGTFTIPLMKRCGYPGEKAAAVEVAASTNGQLMPPIMGAAAFIIAEYCNLPYLDVVRAAFVPAVVSYLGLIYITHLEASKLGLRGLPKEELPKFWQTFLGGIHFLIPLAALLYMLLSGFTPPLAAFWAIVTLAGLVIVRDVIQGVRSSRGAWWGLRRAVRTIYESLASGGHSMMSVGVACAAAGIIVGMVTLGLGQKLTEIVATLSGGSIVLILLLTALASLIIGMGLPTTATYIVMASLTARIIVELGRDAGLAGLPTDPDYESNLAGMVIGAHLFCFFFGILADDTPPVGLAAYAGAAIAKSNPIKTGVQGFVYDLRTAILPFMFIFNTDLLLWGIDSWLTMAVIFACSTVAICAFAALTQHYMIRRNRFYEVPLLALSCGLILRPRMVGELLRSEWGRGVWPGGFEVAGNRFIWYAAGVAVFAAVAGWQWLTREQPRPVTRAA